MFLTLSKNWVCRTNHHNKSGETKYPGLQLTSAYLRQKLQWRYTRTPVVILQIVKGSICFIMKKMFKLCLLGLWLFWWVLPQGIPPGSHSEDLRKISSFVICGRGMERTILVKYFKKLFFCSLQLTPYRKNLIPKEGKSIIPNPHFSQFLGLSGQSLHSKTHLWGLQSRDTPSKTEI